MAHSSPSTCSLMLYPGYIVRADSDTWAVMAGGGNRDSTDDLDDLEFSK